MLNSTSKLLVRESHGHQTGTPDRPEPMALSYDEDDEAELQAVKKRRNY